MARHFLSHFIFHSLFDLFPQCCQTGASLGEFSVFEIIDCTKEIKFIRRWGGMKVIYSYTLFVKMCNDDLSRSLHPINKFSFKLKYFEFFLTVCGEGREVSSCEQQKR